MAQTTTQGAFLTAFQAQLAARAALADVTVTSGFIGFAQVGQSIQLLDTQMDQAWDTIGNIERHERYTVRGLVEVVQAGKTESDIQASRDMAEALLNEVQVQLWSDPQIAFSVHLAQLIGAQYDQGFTTDGRVARIEFSIAVEAYLSL
jgi:hypothetical protein